MRALTVISTLLVCSTLSAHPFAIVRTSSVDMYSEGSFSSTVESQELMGTVVEILEENGKWVKIHSPQPYDAWVTRMNLVFLGDNELTAWANAPKCICTALFSTVHCSASEKSRRICDMVLGDRMGLPEGNAVTKGKWMQVILPDSRVGWVRKCDVLREEEWAAVCRRRTPAQVCEFVTNTALSMLGAPYMWGGCTPKATDCSGLSRMCYMMAGINLPRNASQQFETGCAVAYGKNPDGSWNLDELKCGDLLFFGTAEGDGFSISHVGIYLGNGEMIHSSQLLRINTLSDKGDKYEDTHKLAGVRRIVGF